MTPLEDKTFYHIYDLGYDSDEGYLYLFKDRGAWEVAFLGDKSFLRENASLNKADREDWVKGIRSFYETGEDSNYSSSFVYTQISPEVLLTHSNPGVRSFIKDRLRGKVLDTSIFGWGD